MPGIHIVYCLVYKLSTVWFTHWLMPGIHIVYCLAYTLSTAWHTHCLLPDLHILLCLVENAMRQTTGAWSDFVSTKGRNKTQGVDMNVILHVGSKYVLHVLAARKAAARSMLRLLACQSDAGQEDRLTRYSCHPACVQVRTASVYM